MARADEIVPTRSAGVFSRCEHRRDHPVALLRGRHPVLDRRGRRPARAGAGRRRDDAARAPRRDSPGRRDERVAILVLDARAALDSNAALDLRRRLARHAVQLNAALLFTSVRESATSEERQRIAREVHDGVAQDVASLGYLIDSIAAGATDRPAGADRPAPQGGDPRRRRAAQLGLRPAQRGRATPGVGESVAAFARHVGSHSTSPCT